MIETAYEGSGKVGVVVPHGVLFRGASEGKIRKKTIEENILEAVIGLPANLFFGTGIPAAILVFNKGKGENTDVLFIDASRHYESVKNQNKLREADIQHIVDTYRQFNIGKLQAGVVEEKFSYVASVEEIQENEFNLNIPRYVDTFEEEPEVDIAAGKKWQKYKKHQLKDSMKYFFILLPMVVLKWKYICRTKPSGLRNKKWPTFLAYKDLQLQNT